MSSLAFTVNTETLTFGSHDFYLSANLVERKEIAKRLNLISVEKVEAELQLEKEERMLLSGKIIADVTQQCVRTLVPFSQHLEVKVHEVFFSKTHEYTEDLNEELMEVAELLEGTHLDLGEVVIQLLSLSLDPYPVAPGSKPLEYHDENGSSSPFDILKKK